VVNRTRVIATPTGDTANDFTHWCKQFYKLFCLIAVEQEIYKTFANTNFVLYGRTHGRSIY